MSELSRREGSTGGEDLGRDVVRAKEVFLRGVGCSVVGELFGWVLIIGCSSIIKIICL